MDFLQAAEGYAETYLWQNQPAHAPKRQLDPMHLLQKLHASLDPRTVFASYGKQLQAVLPLYGVQLTCGNLSLQWGRTKGMKVIRTLPFEHETAQLVYYSSTPLNISDTSLLNTAEQLLSQPLSNAQKHQQVAQQAFIDTLTNLGNRLCFNQALDNAIARHRRGNTSLSLLILDLDNFKQLNDSKGHREGDKALFLFAEIMRDSIRSSDQAFRLGGDEFVIIAEGRHESAHHIAERVLSQCAEMPFLKDNQVSCSIGISIADATRAHDEHHLFEEADRALYRAKSSGRNRFCLAAN